MAENNKFDVVGTNIAEKATIIWNVADMLRGPFKPHEYGLVLKNIRKSSNQSSRKL